MIRRHEVSRRAREQPAFTHGPNEHGLRPGHDTGVIVQIVAEKQDVRPGLYCAQDDFLKRIVIRNGPHLQVVRDHDAVITQTPPQEALDDGGGKGGRKHRVQPR